MIIELESLVKKYNPAITGFVHVGGHYGQEYNDYKTFNVPIIFFEPLPNNYSVLKTTIGEDPYVTTYQCALGNENKLIDMNVETANNGQSSSILKPKDHLIQYPHIRFNHTEQVNMFRMDDLDIEISKYNFMNVDVQGYELEVFKGSENALRDNIDYIMTEVNQAEVYENCAHVNDLDAFLGQFNFKRVETEWAGGSWGDAFYIKIKE
jgi:FkbM family methyltransferase